MKLPSKQKDRPETVLKLHFTMEINEYFTLLTKLFTYVLKNRCS